MLKAGETSVTINCSGVDACNDAVFDMGLGIVLRFQQGDIIDYGYAGGYTRSNYNAVFIIVISAGML